MTPEDDVTEQSWKERKMAVKSTLLDDTFAYHREEHTHLDEVQFVVDDHSEK